MKKAIPFLFVFAMLSAPELLAQKPTAKEPAPLSVVEHLPEFPGGSSQMAQFINREIHFPESAKTDTAFIDCRVYIRMVVDTIGQVLEPMILKGCKQCPDCEKEAIRVISTNATLETSHAERKKGESLLHCSD